MADAMKGEITIPGTKKKVPKIAIIAIGGGLIALVLLLRGGKGQARPTGEGTLPDETGQAQAPTGGPPDMTAFNEMARQQMEEQAAAFQAFLASLQGQAQGIPGVETSTPPVPPGYTEASPGGFELPTFFPPLEVGGLVATPAVSEVGSVSTATPIIGPRAATAIKPHAPSTAIATPITPAQRVAERAGLTGNLATPAPAASPIGQRAAAEAARAGSAAVNRAQTAARGIVLATTSSRPVGAPPPAQSATGAINRAVSNIPATAPVSKTPVSSGAGGFKPPAKASAPISKTPVSSGAGGFKPPAKASAPISKAPVSSGAGGFKPPPKASAPMKKR